MSKDEILTFEGLWKKIWEVIYEILKFFGLKNDGAADLGSNTIHYDNITAIY